MALFGGPNIEKLRAARDVDGLLKALDHKRVDVRVEAVRALGQVGDASVVERLLGLLAAEGATGSEEKAVLEAIGRIGGVDQVVSILETGSSLWSRKAAAFTLGKLGGARALTPLVNALKDPQLGPYPAGALVQLGDPGAIGPMVAEVVERLRGIVSQVRPGIDSIQDASGKIDALRRELGKPESSSDWGFLAHSIAKLGPSGLERLGAAIDFESDWLMAWAIAVVLMALGEEGTRQAEARKARLRPEAAGLTTRPSFTLWVEDEEEARRLVADLSNQSTAGEALGRAIAKDGSSDATAFYKAVVDVEVGTTFAISSQGRPNPTRGGFDVTLSLERGSSAPEEAQPVVAPSVARAQSDELYELRCIGCPFTHLIPRDVVLSSVDFSVKPDQARIVCHYGGAFTVTLEVKDFFTIAPVPQSRLAPGLKLEASIASPMRALHGHMLSHQDPLFLIIRQSPQLTVHIYRRQPEGSTYVKFTKDRGVDIVGDINLSKAEIPGVSD